MYYIVIIVIHILQLLHCHTLCYNYCMLNKTLSLRIGEKESKMMDAFRMAKNMPHMKDSDVIRHALTLLGVTRETKVPEKNIAEAAPEPARDEVDDFGGADEVLTPEEKEKGYWYKNGELLDRHGFPVSTDRDGVTVMGGEVYAVDPLRPALKEAAQANMAEVVSIVPEVGTANAALAEFAKAEGIKIDPKHSEPGLVTAEHDGVDGEFEEGDSQETSYE